MPTATAASLQSLLPCGLPAPAAPQQPTHPPPYLVDLLVNQGNIQVLSLVGQHLQLVQQLRPAVGGGRVGEMAARSERQ